MLVPVPRRGPGLNSLLFYRKGGIAEAVTDEAGKGTLQKAQERQLLRFLSFIEIGRSEIFCLPPPKVFTPRTQWSSAASSLRVWGRRSIWMPG